MDLLQQGEEEKEKMRLKNKNWNLKLILLISIMIIAFSSSSFAADPGHGAAAISAGTFEAGNFLFPDQVIISKNLGINMTAPTYLLQVANASMAANISGVLFVNGTSGRVGIGTSDPGASLEVNGTMRISSGDGSGYMRVQPAGCYQGYFGISLDGGCTPDVAIDTSGNFLIFNSISISDGQYYQSSSSGALAGYQPYDGSTGGLLSFRGGTAPALFNFNAWWNDGGWQSYNLITFAVSNFTRTAFIRGGLNVNGTLFVNESNQKVGIGTASPTELLTVNGTANITGATYLGNTLCSSGNFLTADPNTGLLSCGLPASTADGVGITSISPVDYYLNVSNSTGLIGANLTTFDLRYQLEANAWKLANYTAQNASVEAALALKLLNDTNIRISELNVTSNATIMGNGLFFGWNSTNSMIYVNSSGCIIIQAGNTYDATCP